MANKLYVHQLPAGTNFKWMDRNFVLADSQLRNQQGNITDDITNGFVLVREIHGLGSMHSWLGESDRFHADVEITRPEILDWLRG